MPVSEDDFIQAALQERNKWRGGSRKARKGAKNAKGCNGQGYVEHVMLKEQALSSAPLFATEASQCRRADSSLRSE